MAPSTLQFPVLQADNLSKSYGDRLALRGLTFSLFAGHILGFLGPNGAGKTTAIRILTTILEPTSGRFTIGGVSGEHHQQIRRKIGVLPESLGFPKQQTAVEHLTYFGRLYGRKSDTARTNALQLLEEVGLAKRAKSPIGTFSRGMRQRLGIARSLVNDPMVVFLDEPTLGLDPKGQQELLALVEGIARQRNVGIILCSHFLNEIERVCDEVVILRQGQIVAAGPVAEVVGHARRNVVRIQVPPALLTVAMQGLDTLPNILHVTPSSRGAGWLNVELADQSGAALINETGAGKRILEALLQADVPVLSFEAEGGRLQDVFFQLTEESES